MKLYIDDKPVDVIWEDNESVAALKKLAGENNLVIQMSRFGGFEQVGYIGRNLPRRDVQTSTSPGDIVLYSGNQIVVFHGYNSWAYTRLGKIQGLDQNELRMLLGDHDVRISLVVEN